MSDTVLVSASPTSLSKIQSWDTGVELKFDWEHEAILRGNRNLSTVLDETAVDIDRIESVHLPPGLGHDGAPEKMALTNHNRGEITSFVHDQLAMLPDARLVVHPPKSFDYAGQLELTATMLDLTDREFAVENTPDDSDWYTPEALAFFGFVGRTYDRLDGLSLTIDSGHLPASDDIDRLDEPDPEAVERLESNLRASGSALPSAFEESVAAGLENVRSYLPAAVDDWRSLAYAPTLKTLCMAGESVSEVHLNDPIIDEVPAFDSHDQRPLLDAVLDCICDCEASIVLEPGTLSRSALRERVTALKDRL